MPRPIPIGEQNYSSLREDNCFYVDKTHFISEWWKEKDRVTLITRPRRFGKTLMLDTVRTFFSPEFKDRPELFAGLSITQDEKLMALRGKVPVIFLSFASIKGSNYRETLRAIKYALEDAYGTFRFLLNDEGLLTDHERKAFLQVSREMPDEDAKTALHELSKYLERFYGIKPIILLDEYDTPMQEAWLAGYWDEIVGFLRGFFNSTFKTNPHLGRGLMTGITRVSKESLFSDLNNLRVVTVTSPLYSDCFGFTEEEVFAAMDEYGLTDKAGVKAWYDGFIFGKAKDIYNPWSVIGYLSERRLLPYWAGTSSNAMVGELIGTGDALIKEQAEILLKGGSVRVAFDEQIVFSQLRDAPGAIWSFLLAAGYVKVLEHDDAESEYEIALTNHEVTITLERLIGAWFNKTSLSRYSAEFRRALIAGDLISLNQMLNIIAGETFSWFDVTGREPERFYHGFVLGLLVDLKKRYALESNRESGFGRYDVMLIPLDKDKDPGIVIEFKTLNSARGEKELGDAAAAALEQIRERNYAAELLARGIPAERIHAYGIAFQGKSVLVAGGRAEI